jgi:regulation of enolase protein 1 (concanavalin A-like superfamily)
MAESARRDHTHSRLLLRPDSATDFWQRTHYGFRAGNGHFLYSEISGDAIVTTTVRYTLRTNTIKAGLLVRFSAGCWLKKHRTNSIPGTEPTGNGVTTFGFSDWSLQNFPLRRGVLDGALCP